ncbi:hypothetical protein LCGC14_0930910 [marine sediment metagenome]|uniref:Uncharacterized protein n=1 Tax=marine sediment metagenome TaxID=412755 RepID=A0A0F9P8W6_9ZZZZ
MLITEKDRKELQDFQKQLMTLFGSLDDIDKTSSRLRNEATELYLKNDKKLDET